MKKQTPSPDQDREPTLVFHLEDEPLWERQAFATPLLEDSS